MFIRLMLVTTILMITGCSFKSVDLRHQADVNFNELKTYSLFEQESAFTEQQNINDNLRNGIELAIENAFDHHGFSYANIDDADIMVAYALTGLPVLKPFNYTNSGVQCDYCLNEQRNKNNAQDIKEGKRPKLSKNRNSRKRNQQLYEADNDRDIGALVIDILDRETLSTLWESEYPLKVDAEDSSIKVQKRIQEAVDEIMIFYSKRAIKN